MLAPLAEHLVDDTSLNPSATLRERASGQVGRVADVDRRAQPGAASRSRPVRRNDATIANAVSRADAYPSSTLIRPAPTNPA
jgi:hypothetical protein